MIAGPLSTDAWESFLAEQLQRVVRVSYSRARNTPVEAVFEGPVMRLRLHRFFAGAPESVRGSLAAWLRSGRRARRASTELDAWIDAQREALPPQKRRRPRLTTAGTHHDLAALATELFATEFSEDFIVRRRPAITWGRRARSQARRSLTLGSYDPHTHIVRIHPTLDSAKVPEWFVRYLLFHEILHAALEHEPACDGSHRFHGSAFRRREEAYRDYERALRWQNRHLPRLIKHARKGSPAPQAVDRRRRGIQAWLFRL
ncbi:MAG: hypothetical protein ACE10D_10510 [Planctomycetota bacterium]